MPNYLYSVGVDVSKQHLDAYHIVTQETVRFNNDIHGIQQFITWIKNWDNPVVIIEPTGGYELMLQSELLAHHIAVAKVNAIRIRQFARSIGKQSKTDAEDAKVLALYGKKIEPKLMVMQAPEQENLAALVTRRRQLVDMITAEKNRLAKVRNHYALNSIRQTIDYLKKELVDMEQSITEVIQESETLYPAFEVLASIKGVGDIAGAVLLAELPELGKIGNKQISSLVGVAPFDRSSGQIKGNKHIYGGRHTVRCMLYLVSLSAIRYDPDIKKFYHSMKQRGKPSKVAIVACMRKIIVIANARLRDFYLNTA